MKIFSRMSRLCAIFIALQAFAFAAETIKIGLSGPFTGGTSPGGVAMRDGVKLAAEEINKAGGVLKRQIQLVERDDESRNDLGVQVTKELIEKEHVVATVGYCNTGVGLSSHRFYEEAEIPVIVNCATGSVLTRQFLPPEFQANYIFRNSANDLVQTSMIAEETANVQHFKKPAILADSTNYGQLGKADLTAALAKRGLTPVINEKFNIGDTDMTAQLLRAREAGADVILIYGIGQEMAQVANGMAKLDWKVPMIGAWGLSYSNFIDTAGKNGDGSIMPMTFIQSPSTPRRKAFIDAYQKRFGIERMSAPSAAAQGYDSLYLLVAAIAQAGSTNGVRIREALENLNEKIYGVVTTYDKPFSASDHEAITDNIAVFGVVKDGRVVPAHPDDFEGEKAIRLKPKA